MARTATAGRARVRRGGAPFLPEDLIVSEILVRLPAKDLLRYRAVCRSWRRVTSSADFLLAHHRHQPSLPLVTFHDRITGSSRDFVDAAVDAFDLWGPPAGAERQSVLRFDDYNNRRDFTVHASCDGLLVLSLSNHRFYICNPATRQWTALPKHLSGCQVAALYHHSSSGEYRILYWTGNVCDAHYFVLTVGSSLEPRYFGGLFKASASPSVLLHNCLHWVVVLNPWSSENELRVLVFDITLESFRYITAPTTEKKVGESLFQMDSVFEMDGRLAVSCIGESKGTLDVWVLQDYKMEVWSLKYRIELPMAELGSIVNDCPIKINALILSEDGDILVYHRNRSCGHPLFYCDKKGKVLRKFQWDRLISMPIRQWFKESLVRYPFFQKQARARVRQPRFFRGL